MPGDTQATDAQMRDTFIEHLAGQFVTGRDGAAAYFDWWLTQRDERIKQHSHSQGWAEALKYEPTADQTSAQCQE